MAERGRLLSAAAFLLFSLVGSLAILLALEGVLALVLRSEAGSGPEAFEEARRRYHLHHERAIVQYLPECAEYDAELGYRLRPGSCRFRTRAFDTGLEINSLGVRDSEEALRAPEIVVLGDSYAMGWGVAKDETLAAQLEAITGAKTLNAAVSSYGTAREMLLFARTDPSALRALVIQTCENDFAENRAFVAGNASLRVASKEAYAARANDHAATTRYFPGKHVRHFVPLLWRGWRGFPAPDPVRPCARDAEAFAAVLRAAPPPPGPVQLVVLEGLYGPGHETCFARALGERLDRLPAWARSPVVLDTGRLLDVDDYLPLDHHWNARGHRKLAEAVAAALH